MLETEQRRLTSCNAVRGAVAAAAMLLAVLPTSAEETLVTDRPDFTESSSVVGVSVVQLEGGFTFADFAEGSEATTAGEILVRWGVFKNLEVRLGLPTYTWIDESDGSSSGFLDSFVGLKYQVAFAPGSGFLGGMEAALIVSTTIPTGGAEVASSEWQPAAILALGWDLGGNLGAGANFGVGRPADGEDRYTTAWASGVLGVGLSDEVSLFFELIGFNREEVRGPNTLTFQTGAVYLLSPDLQLDVRAARRLTDRGADLLLGTGVSWRLGG
jgi:hypothetical protein